MTNKNAEAYYLDSICALYHMRVVTNPPDKETKNHT